MEKENIYLNLYLGSLKEPWLDYCKKLGKSPGNALKQIVEKQLKLSPKKNTAYKPKTFKQTKESADDSSKQRFEVLLTQSEKTALELRAQQEQCSQRRWVIDRIRAGLTEQAQFSMKEIELLGESNYQLLAIGRNLNQIAKAFNEGATPTNTLELIKRLTDIIERHTKKVSRAIRASLERWDMA